MCWVKTNSQTITFFFSSSLIRRWNLVLFLIIRETLNLVDNLQSPTCDGIISNLWIFFNLLLSVFCSSSMFLFYVFIHVQLWSTISLIRVLYELNLFPNTYISIVFYCVEITSWLWHHILVFTWLACHSWLILSADRGDFIGRFLLFPAALACWKLVALPASSQQGSLAFLGGVCILFLPSNTRIMATMSPCPPATQK